MKFQKVIIGVLLSLLLTVLLTEAVTAGTYGKTVKKKSSSVQLTKKASAGASRSSTGPLPRAYLLPPAAYNPYASSSVMSSASSSAQPVSSRISSIPYFAYLSSSYGYAFSSGSSRSVFQLSSRSAHSTFSFAFRSSASAFSLRSRSSMSTGTYPFHTGCQNKHLLSQLFGNDQMTCGSTGWTFPGLIWGECPMTACILKTQPGSFGGPSNF